MAQSHITIVLNYGQFAGNTTIGEQLAYAAHAAQDGIRVIWPTDAFRYSSDGGTTLAGQFPALSQSLRQQCGIGTMTNEAFVECFAASVAGSAGTWGYYVGDELPISDESMIRHVVDALYHSDAHHPRLYVASDPGGYANTSTLTAYGRPYSDGRYDISDATVIAQDYYPIGTSQGGQAAQYAANIAAGVARLARDFGDRYAMVLQAHSLAAYPSLYPWCKSTAQCPYPTPAQMIAMRNAVVRQGTPQMIMWYSFFNTIGSRWSQDAPAFA